ncbi:MAG: hypothetical protein ACOZQL_12390 [Myxococcota bacterium]
MDPFVRKLVERLFDEGSPLSRNRHFHTFESEEGKRALRISRRLKALQRDISECRAAGNEPRVTHSSSDEGEVKVEIVLEHLKSKRTTTLDEAEYELLLRLSKPR